MTDNSHLTSGASYAAAGVDIDAGERAVELFAPHAKRATRPEVMGGLGGFAGLFSLKNTYRQPLLASSTDGVGTKIAVAQAMDVHNTVGIDLIAMIVDDLVVCGAEPLFVQDYIAIGKVVPEHVASIVEGIAEGCVQAGCALLGGETAEHPGLMAPGEYDISGTGVGIVEADEVLQSENVRPGDVIIGADSHTCTYGALGAFATGVGSTDMAAGMALGKAWFKVPSAIKVILDGKPGPWVSGKDVILHLIGRIGVEGAQYRSLEFTGPGVSELSMDDRFTVANMAIEAGAKNGIFPVDEKTRAYAEAHPCTNPHMRKAFRVFEADADAVYEETIRVDLSKVELTVAFPHLPENARPVREAKGIAVDQVVIGSCTNGRMEDMAVTASLLKGRKVAPGVRLIIIPGTQQIWLDCLAKGWARLFVEAGAVFSTPTCGPCLGGHTGVLAAGEVALSTTNRNFVGRMGHPESQVFLAGPAVAAATAILGTIASPFDL